MFKKAERKKATLKLAITAPSGGGKTYSALRLAKGLGGKIAVIDTENGSASLYADRFEFDTMTIDAPYTITKYTAAIKAAEAAGYQVCIVDSLSHAWAGDGGLLAKKEALDARGGNSYTNWGSITKEHEAFKAALLNSKMHLICTMRSKQDYVMEVNEKGKSAPRKVGLAPIQREGMEYEFTTVFDIAMDHNASISKDRTGLFDGQIFQITEETGTALNQWLLGAKEADPVQAAPTQAPAPVTPIKPAAVQDPQRPQALCEHCKIPLAFSAKSQGHYCPNFKDKSVQHSYVPAAHIDAFIQKQNQVAEEDVPLDFEFEPPAAGAKQA